MKGRAIIIRSLVDFGGTDQSFASIHALLAFGTLYFADYLTFLCVGASSLEGGRRLPC